MCNGCNNCCQCDTCCDSCIANILQTICNLQCNVCEDTCLNCCDKPYLGACSNCVTCNTRPITIYCGCTGTPWTLPVTVDETETTTTVFRLEKINNCCATFRALVPNTDTTSAYPYVATNTFFSMNIECICALNCLPDTYVECI